MHELLPYSLSSTKVVLNESGKNSIGHFQPGYTVGTGADTCELTRVFSIDPTGKLRADTKLAPTQEVLSFAVICNKQSASDTACH